ncbi:hypothetical protein TNCV_1908921 [Trichonephila clavipes]|nr:hypothetical protein TNCV_1908921 [Trichonephila clavipes]
MNFLPLPRQRDDAESNNESVDMADPLSVDPQEHCQLLKITDYEDNAKMIEAKSKYIKELISIVEEPNANSETKQGLQTEMKRIEEQKDCSGRFDWIDSLSYKRLFAYCNSKKSL